MKNFIQPGDSLAMAVPYADGVTAGQPEASSAPGRRRGARHLT
jgi:hypothetical protein